MAKKDETNRGRTGQRMGGDEWLKGTKPQSERRRRKWGGCCHTEAKAITHLLLKIMKKLNELIISGERDRKTEMEEGTKGHGKGKEPGRKRYAEQGQCLHLFLPFSHFHQPSKFTKDPLEKQETISAVLLFLPT